MSVKTLPTPASNPYLGTPPGNCSVTRHGSEDLRELNSLTQLLQHLLAAAALGEDSSNLCLQSLPDNGGLPRHGLEAAVRLRAAANTGSGG